MDDARATAEALASDTGSGAAEIAERAARALAAFPRSELSAAIETLVRRHPEMAPLWQLGSDLLSSADPGAGARAFLSRLERDEGAIDVLAPVLPERLLTISYSSTVREALRGRRPASVLCMSSDPGGEGARMAKTLWSFTDAAVIEDEVAITRCPADAVLVGADAVTPTSLVNKVKTSLIARSARDHGVPCYAIAGETKLVPFEVRAREPFEPTDLGLFSGIATPTGLLSPADAARQASAVVLHADLRRLAGEFVAAGRL